MLGVHASYLKIHHMSQACVSVLIPTYHSTPVSSLSLPPILIVVLPRQYAGGARYLGHLGTFSDC